MWKTRKPDFAGNYSYEELADIYNNDRAGQYTVEQLQALLERTRASIYPQEGKYYRLINKARPNDGSMDNTLTICDAMPPMNLGVRQIVEKFRASIRMAYWNRSVCSKSYAPEAETNTSCITREAISMPVRIRQAGRKFL